MLKKRTFILALFLLPSLAYTQEFNFEPMMRNIRRFSFGGNSGTGLLVSFRNHDFIITARHIIGAKAAKFDTINIDYRYKGKVQSQPVIYVPHDKVEVDIAVLDLMTDQNISNNFSLTSEDIAIGQEVYFFGYPLGWGMVETKDFNFDFGHLIPLAKRGMISGFIPDVGDRTVLVDGMNVRGFSGGPVAVIDTSSHNPSRLRVIGITTSYIVDSIDVPTPCGTVKIPQNTGLVYAPVIGHAIELINSYVVETQKN